MSDLPRPLGVRLEERPCSRFPLPFSGPIRIDGATVGFLGRRLRFAPEYSPAASYSPAHGEATEAGEDACPARARVGSAGASATASRRHRCGLCAPRPQSTRGGLGAMRSCCAPTDRMGGLVTGSSSALITAARVGQLLPWTGKYYDRDRASPLKLSRLPFGRKRSRFV